MKSRYKESTIDRYTYVFNLHILPYFWKRPISGITPKDIRAWQTELMGKGYSDAYLLRINNMIVSILNFAVSYYDLPSNPCHKAGSMGKRTTVVIFWTIEEYQKILSSVTDKTAHIMFQVFYYSGFRCGEFLALTLEDIDFKIIKSPFQRVWDVPVEKTLSQVPKRQRASERFPCRDLWWMN